MNLSWKIINTIIFTFSIHATTVGFLDNARVINGDTVRISGWACERRSNQNLEVQIYAGGDRQSGDLVTSSIANSKSEAGVRRACQNNSNNNRYRIDLKLSNIYKFSEKKLYAYAKRPNGTYTLLRKSGQISMPKIEDPFKGVIDGAKLISDQGVRIWGWACKIKSNQDQTIALFVGGDQKSGTLLKTITTDVNSEDGIQRSCQNQNTTNRYGLNITQKEAYSHAGKTIYAYIKDSSNDYIEIHGSGNHKIPTVDKPDQEQILGEITSIRRYFDGLTVEGWSCHSGVNESNAVHVYAKNGSDKTFLKGTYARLQHQDPEINKRCRTNVPHKFKVTISNKILMDKGVLGNDLIAYGLAKNNNIHNSLIENPKNFKIPSRVLVKLNDIYKENEDLMIIKNQEVIMYGNYNVGQIKVHGILRCTHGNSNIRLRTTGIMVHGMGAQFECGRSAAHPFKGTFEISLKPGKELEMESDMGHNHSMGEMAIAAMMGGTIRLHGVRREIPYTTLSRTANKGDRSISVIGDMQLSPGDEIVIAPTGFNFREAETRIVDSVDVKAKSSLISFKEPLKYVHLGEIERHQTPRGEKSIEMRAHVAVLDRNIFISPDGDIKEFDETKIGGHIMVMKGAYGYIDSVRLERMGQLGLMGRYPFHWHRAHNVKGQYFSHSSVTNSYQRCVTIHATHEALVENNVCYNHLGHGFFFEEGHEQNNIMRGNLGILSRKAPADRALLESDFKSRQKVRFDSPSTFWISNPFNTVDDNIAAGYEGTGFWNAFDRQMTCVQEKNECRVTDKTKGEKANFYPSRMKTISFKNNTAYSGVVGFSWDGAPSGKKTNNPNNEHDRETISSHYFGYKTNEAKFTPEFPNLTTFKNINAGVYYRGTTAIFDNFKAADNGVSIFVAYNQKFTNSLIIGHSDFITEDEKLYQMKKTNWKHGHRGVLHYKKMKGFVTYDGPAHLTNVHFAGFPEEKIFDHGFDLTPAAIHLFGGSSHYEHKFRGISFEGSPYHKVNFNRDKWNGWMDEVNHVRLRDIDGSIYGKANHLIVPNHPILRDPRCEVGPVQSNTLICNYDLGVLWFRIPITKEGKTTTKVDFIATRSDGAEYGPLEEGFRHNSKLGIIMDNHQYTVELDRSNLKVPKVLFEHQRPHLFSPVIKFTNTRACRVKIQNRGDLTKVSSLNALRNTNKTAYFKDSQGNIHIRFKTNLRNTTNEAAHKSDTLDFVCSD